MIAKELRERGIDVRIQDELADIPRQTEDVEWAKLVAAQGWLAITRDKRIQYRAAEKQALVDAKLGLFVLVSRRNLTRSEIVDQIALAVPKMLEFLKNNKPPFIAGIYQDGRLVMRENL